MNKLAIIISALTVLIYSCKEKETTEPTPPLCKYANRVYEYHNGFDSAFVWIPNCFTPNGDGKNDKAFIVYYHIQNASVSIKQDSFLIFSGDILNTWDGEIGGVKAPERIYNVEVKGKTIYGTDFTYSGTISLLRREVPGINKTKANVQCDSCKFFSQIDSTGYYNPTILSGEDLISDSTYTCVQ